MKFKVGDKAVAFDFEGRDGGQVRGTVVAAAQGREWERYIVVDDETGRMREAYNFGEHEPMRGIVTLEEADKQGLCAQLEYGHDESFCSRIGEWHKTSDGWVLQEATECDWKEERRKFERRYEEVEGQWRERAVTLFEQATVALGELSSDVYYKAKRAWAGSEHERKEEMLQELGRLQDAVDAALGQVCKAGGLFDERWREELTRREKEEGIVLPPYMR